MLAWASSFYLPAILAGSMGRDIGISTQAVFAAFSVALILAALLGPRAGRYRHGWIWNTAGAAPVSSGRRYTCL